MKSVISNTKFIFTNLRLVLFISCILPVFSFAQVGEWTWMNGANVYGRLANYGTQGTFSNTTVPSGLYEACQWTDTNGLFWLFGGMDSNGNLNGDLWEYDPSVQQWSWMNGTGTVNDPGYYGTKGVPSLGNIPPSRSHGMATWTDKNNNLWFFGGGNAISSSHNDLWEYNIVNEEWTWMNGPNTTGDPGHYGTMGLPDTLNLPPCRSECSATWVDSLGDLWLFGGRSYPSGNVFNDLWRYHIATNTWTWMKGSNTVNQASTWGTKAIESPSNVPAARAAYTHLMDNHQNLWIFGGITGPGGLLNDIWRYNPYTNNWVWLGGSKGVGALSVYGTQCTADSNNIPGGRFENRACWTDKNGNLWFFGGFTTASGQTPDLSNELWLYCIESNKWTFVSGDTVRNPIGSWGTKGVSSPTNKPDGRGGSLGWIEKSFANLYMFGGSTDVFPACYNDMWRFTIDTTCGTCPEAVIPVANFQASDSTICANGCVTYTDLSTNATSWIWTFPGGTPSSSTDENPFVCYDSAGVFNVTLIATSYKGSGTISCTNCVHVKPVPVTPEIKVLSGDTLYFHYDTSYVSYQWYDSASIIPNATDTFIVVNHSSNFNVKITGKDSCSIAVGINYKFVGINEFTADGLQFTVLPNPAGNKLTITGNWKLEIENWKLGIYNVLGEKVNSPQSEIRNPKSEIVLDVSALSSGIYFLQISNDKGRWIGKFVKE